MLKYGSLRRVGMGSSLVALGVSIALDANAQAASGTTASGLEEVVVTAQRREENLGRAAAAITALSADSLRRAGVTEVENLNRLVPGLAVGIGGPSTQIYLRGVGSYGTNAFADPAVQFTVDGIAYSRVTGMGGNFFDLQRVEVLKGPQGTLYGRNATGGAVNLITNQPAHEFAAGAGVDVGNYSLTKLDGFINVPLGDAWAARAALLFVDRDGFQTDGTNDEETRAGRLHVLYEPSEDFRLLLSGSIVELGGKGFGQVPYRASGYVANSNPWTGPQFTAPAALQAQSIANGQPPTLFTNGVTYANGDLDVEVQSLGAQMDWNVGGAGTVTVLANQLSTDNDTVSYGPGFLFSPRDHAEQWSIEARLAGSNDRWQWIGGVFVFEEEQDFRFWVDQGFLFNQTGADIHQLDDSTEAVFGQVTFSMTDHLRLSGGLRYTQEEKTLRGQIWNRRGAPCAAIGATDATIANIAAEIPWAATNELGVAYPFPYCRDTSTGDEDWDDTSWKVGLEYDLGASASSLLYANVARGFKAGGFYAAGDHSVVGNSYDPEELIAYSVGWKGGFADGRIRLYTEAFYWDYQDHQEGYLAPTNPPVPAFGFITINVPEAEIYGLDIEFDALITDVDELNIRAQYLEAEYTDFTYNTSRPGEFATNRPGSQPPNTVCDATFVSIGLYSVNCDGQQMPRSPEFSAQATYSHTFALSGGGTVVPSVGMQYSSDYWTAVDYNPLQKQDSFTMWDADISYNSSDSSWSVTAYIRNIGEEDVWQNSFVHPSGVAFNALRSPRVYGARFRVDF